MEYVNSIMEDVRWLNAEGDGTGDMPTPWEGPVRHTSDYFELLHECAVHLIRSGDACVSWPRESARARTHTLPTSESPRRRARARVCVSARRYVDSLDAETMREYRGTLTTPGRDSPDRERPIEESLSLFEAMRRGEVEEGALALRLKIDMASPNMNLRDPVIYRIVTSAAHPITGNEWSVYPMYDYAHCISDAVERITHSCCTLEFEDHRPLYDWVLDKLSGASLVQHVVLPALR